MSRGQAPPPVPAPAVPPPAEAPAGPPASREAQLEERVRQLEGMVNRLADKLEEVNRPPLPAASSPGASTGTTAGGAGTGSGGGTGGGGSAKDGSDTSPKAEATTKGGSGKAAGGSLSPGQGLPSVPAPKAGVNMPPVNRKDALKGTFGPGFMLKTDDDEYVLQFHNLTQVDFRGYEQGGQTPVHDTFAIPRQWFMFSGRITKPYEYFVSLQVAFDTVLPLDVFINVNYDERLQFRVGRWKTPFTYEFYNEPIQGLVNTERSLFFNNFALNRQVGAAFWGQLFQKRVDYSTGIFNTAQNGVVDLSDGKNFLAYLAYRPFLLNEDSFLQYLNIGGSVDLGNQVNTPIPQTLRTQVATTGNNVAGIPFLAFNNNVRQAGDHTLWSMHAALYRKHLSLIGEWQSGFQDYAPSANLKNRTQLPIDSFYVKGGYFITGETVTGRGMVSPLRPFSLKDGQRGLGAIELQGRYNLLTLGNQVFSEGLADPNNWTNRVFTTDAGVNWYLNQYVKVVLEWQHAEFGDPVLFAPGRRQLTSDTFWFRFQLFF